MSSSDIPTVYHRDTETDRFLDDFPVHCHFRSGPIGQNSMHAHKGYEFYFCLEGQGKFLVGDRVFSLHPGSLLMIKPHVLHWSRVINTNALHRVVLSMEEQFAAELGNSMPALALCIHKLFDEMSTPCLHWQLDNKKTERMRDILFRISREIEEKAPFYEAAMHHLLAEMFVLLAREQTGSITSQEPPNPSNLAEHVLQYMTSHYSETIEVSRLHELFNVSRSHLYEHFKQWTGQPLNRYLTLFRLHQAKRLLLDTPLSVTEIASAVGFGDLSHFFHTFKTEIGQTPSAYRKQHTVPSKNKK
ncbi:AraC family transcriptional regulator [Paenibacillus sp. HWE-109]|uniref:AraC family transcriptional regulator n=1 Tax=Paenibacillus sp. HWE-109 TaxID=1306526 RepID=UPI001EDD702F|nr:AraC family transcriptional regulator [Paenibacillus sp. HWE-109]UKS29780.1 AraC family transcriptional regulator [Paenibacillus sp. HWE-109]